MTEFALTAVVREGQAETAWTQPAPAVLIGDDNDLTIKHTCGQAQLTVAKVEQLIAVADLTQFVPHRVTLADFAIEPAALRCLLQAIARWGCSQLHLTQLENAQSPAVGQQVEVLVTELVELLPSLSALRVLELSLMGLTNQAIINLALALPQLPELQTLNLSGNPAVGWSAAQALSVAAVAGARVKNLDLADCGIGSEGAELLVETACNTALSLLNLGPTRIQHEVTPAAEPKLSATATVLSMPRDDDESSDPIHCAAA